MTVVRIPGKVMLSGEYAVLAGERALAVTVDRAMTVEMVWDQSSSTLDEAGRSFDAGQRPVLLESNLWDAPRTLTQSEREPFAAVVRYGIEKSGLTPVCVRVQSDLDVRYGLGSSSALRLGVSLGFRSRTHDRETARKLAEKDAFALQFAHQALASGYDILTQSRGGLVTYEPTLPWPGSVASQSIPPSWSDHVRILGGGKGAPTGPVMQETLAWMTAGGRQELLLPISRQLTESLLQTGKDANAWSPVYRACGVHREFFQQAPHEPRSILSACEQIAGVDRSWSLKTTGAGGEDALLLFGKAPDIAPVLELLSRFGWEMLPIAFASDGAQVNDAEAVCL